jgi:glycosyltransferase involved in cell wall biosynthesis
MYIFLARRALTNIIHNEPLRNKIAKWNVPTLTLGNIPYYLATDKDFPFKHGFNVAVVNTYSDDEPLDEVLMAAKRMPDVNFYITGNLDLAPESLRSAVPQNVILTGFIPHAEYVALLKGCDIAVVLTKMDFTMQNGAYEAMELERPIITSDWPVLRNTFSRGALHIPNDATSLIKAVEQMQADYPFYLNGIKSLRAEMYDSWGKNLAALLRLFESKSS